MAAPCNAARALGISFGDRTAYETSANVFQKANRAPAPSHLEPHHNERLLESAAAAVELALA